jgi:hypothetical protein
MSFFGFKVPLKPNLIKLYKRHPRGESEEMFEWVLPMAGVRKFSLRHPLEKSCKTGKMNLVS